MESADKNEVDEIRDAYRRLAVAWHQASRTPEVANKLFDDHHAFYTAVRDSSAGRAAS